MKTKISADLKNNVHLKVKGARPEQVINRLGAPHRYTSHTYLVSSRLIYFIVLNIEYKTAEAAFLEKSLYSNKKFHERFTTRSAKQ